MNSDKRPPSISTAKFESREKIGGDEVTTPSSPLPPYSGDTFGTQGNYVDGMLYLSRMKLSPNNKPTAANLWGLRDKLVTFGVDEAEMQQSFKQKLKDAKARNDNNISHSTKSNKGVEDGMGNHGDEDDLTGKQGNNNIEDEVSSSVFSNSETWCHRLP